MSLNVLSFVWRRRSTGQAPLSPLPPLVTASTSADTCDHYDDAIQVPTRHSPLTPGGLRPRHTIERVREHLNLPLQREQGRSDRLELPSERERDTLPLDMLPPRLSHYSSSWSVQGIMSSPPISTSSFYAKSDDVAESPNLVPGQARTAVGALVAKHHSFAHEPKRFHPQQEPSGILPPHSNLHDCNDHYFVRYNHQDDRIHDNIHQYLEQSQIQYQSLATPAATPERHQRPTSPTGSLMIPSPSSLAMKEQQITTKNDISFSSRAKLIDKDDQYYYDFEPIVAAGTEVVLCGGGDPRNMSAMSMSRCVSVEDEGRAMMMHEDNSNDNSLQAHLYPRCESRHERQQLEDMFASVVERLQDNVDLVASVEAVGDAIVFGEWFVQTRVHEEGLLTGFSPKCRQTIAQNLTVILQEMDKVQHEEYYLDTTVELEQFADTHEVLRDSLVFCRRLVSMADPRRLPHYKVKEGVPVALGVLRPETPEVHRGGDTSVFSLPDSETPMTSNVSLTTTITTHHTSPNAFRTTSSTPNLRRTMEMVTALLQMMTRACHRLGNMSSESWGLGTEVSIRVTEEIKRAYQQVVALDVEDLKALQDAFEETSRGLSPPRILPRAPVLTPPRREVFDDVFLTDEGTEMEWTDEREPNDTNHRGDQDEIRDDVEEREISKNLNVLALCCKQLAQAE